MGLVGGLRARMIDTSAQAMLEASLEALGWFTSTPARRDVMFLDERIDLDQPVEPNLVTYFSDIRAADPAELGSQLAEHRWTHFVEVFGENESWGGHLAHDVLDIIEGRIPSIGRSQPRLQVFDWSMATPVPIFVVEIEDIVLDRPQAPTRPSQRFMWSIRFDTLDFYADEAG